MSYHRSQVPTNGKAPALTHIAPDDSDQARHGGEVVLPVIVPYIKVIQEAPSSLLPDSPAFDKP